MTKLNMRKEKDGIHEIIEQPAVHNKRESLKKSRDDAGQPLLYLQEPFILHDSQPIPAVPGTLSDPDSSKENDQSSHDVLTWNSENGVSIEVTRTPSAAVISDELQNTEKQQTVQDMLSYFEHNLVLNINNGVNKKILCVKPVRKPKPMDLNEHPIPKPCLTSKPKPKVKPKPLNMLVYNFPEHVRNIQESYTPRSIVKEKEKVVDCKIQSPTTELTKSQLHKTEANYNKKPSLLPPKDVSSPFSFNINPKKSPAISEEEDCDSDEDEDDLSDDEELAIPGMPQDRAKMLHLEGTERKIYHIVTEILTTEKSYVRRLHLLEKVFHGRFVEEAKENNVIPEKVVNEIFPNLSPIYEFHSTILLPELEARLMEWETIDKIGDIFKTQGHNLLLYTDFVRNFYKATKTLNNWIKKSSKLAAVVEELQKRPECENLSLQAHMLEPVQRVPRYKLLLQEYLKNLPSDSPDREESEASLVIISKAARQANDSMKENKNFKKLIDIEDKIQTGLNGERLVTTSRVFLKEGELTKIAARSIKRKARTTIMLFNDCLLYCSLTAIGKLHVRKIMDLDGLSIDEVDSTLPQNSFRIKSRQRIIDLIAHNEEEKEEWVAAIRAAVTDLHEKKGSIVPRMPEEHRKSDMRSLIGQAAPLWVKDEDVSMCMLCASKFGLVHRRHHCRGCGWVVCGRCSSYQAKLEYSGDEDQRICVECFKTLDDNTTVVLNRNPATSIDMCGEVFWKPPGKGWSKEWVVLTEFALYIQKKKQDVKAHFTLSVPGYEVDTASSADEIDKAHPHCIKLYITNKKDLTYFISSDSKEIITQWKEHLEHAKKAQKIPIKEKERE